MTSVELEQTVTEFVHGILGTSNVEISDFQAGGNNRLLLVKRQTEKLVAKRYFQHGQDAGKRQTAEWAFLKHADRLGMTNVPRPIGIDLQNSITVMSMLEGEKISGSPTEQQIIQAGEFISQLNAEKPISDKDIPAAAESGFSCQMHSELLENRLQRLTDSLDKQDEFPEFSDLLSEMKSTYTQWKATTEKAEDFERVLSSEEQILSPSDFGFHNILINQNNELQFLDFEYAGLDDPAKLICDFFWQPAIPVDRNHMDQFTRACLATSDYYVETAKRIKLLDPLFGLRWCCIILNPFLPEWAPRQNFVNPDTSLKKMKQERLERAQGYMKRVKSLMG